MNPLRYIQLAFVLAVLGAGAYFAWSYRDMAQDLAKVEQRVDQAEADSAAAKRNYETLSEEIVSRAEVDAMIRASRQHITINLDEVEDEDPVARDYLRERIPDSVRGAYLDDNAAER